MLRPTAAGVCGRCCRLRARRASTMTTTTMSARRALPTSVAAAAAASSRLPARQASAFSWTAAARTDSSSPQQEPSSSSTPSTPRNLYEYFPQTLPDGPPPAGHFPIDAPALRREFLRLQAAHHPDKHPAAGKALAEARSSAINHAYRTLANPLLRAQYLLSLRGVDVATDESLKVEEPGLLAAVLDAHEAVEEAAGPHDLDPLREENEERIRRSEEVLERAFRDDDVDAAKREAVRLRYWVNIRESVHDWEEGRPVVLQH